MRMRDAVSEAEEPYNLIALTDMVFNLLIFFMCATTFVQIEREMSLQLPRTGMELEKASPVEGRPLVVNIRPDGATLIDGKVCGDAELSERVRNALAAQPDMAITIRADQQSIVKHFADVTRICKTAGAREVKLVYVESGSP